MRRKYSVVIPIYNAEKTLQRCLDSLLVEPYPDMELILVNDGSFDSSGEICQKYARKYPLVRYIEKENGGVSTARNAGLDIANGKYILFVDSDDYVMPDFFYELDMAIEKYPCDLIQFSYCFDNGRNKRDRIQIPFFAENRNNLMPQLINDICRKKINTPWAKLYCRDIIEANNIRFPVGASIAEDRVFNIKYSMYIQSYVVTDQIIYIVSTENENSLTRGRHKDLEQQFTIINQYFADALQTAPIPEMEKGQYQQAVNFGDCRSIYHDAKLMHQDGIGWFERQIKLWRSCRVINGKNMKYPRTHYCTLITLPVRFNLTLVIDVVAWKLIH